MLSSKPTIKRLHVSKTDRGYGVGWEGEMNILFLSLPPGPRCSRDFIAISEDFLGSDKDESRDSIPDLVGGFFGFQRYKGLFFVCLMPTCVQNTKAPPSPIHSQE